MAKQTIPVPDIGGAENVDVIEVCVAAGDTVAAEDSLIVLESDKASMDIPSPMAGKIVNVLIKEGDTVSEGDAILELEAEGEGDDEGGSSGGSADSAPEPAEEEPSSDEANTEDKQSSAEEPDKAKTEDKQSSAEKPDKAKAEDKQSTAEEPVNVPEIGGAEGVDVIEVCVAEGDEIKEGDSLIVLESDKASMEVPSPADGRVVSLSLKEGAKVSEGDEILILAKASGDSAQPSSGGDASSATKKEPEPAPSSSKTSKSSGPIEVKVPDIGGSENVDVIEVCVAEGDEIAEGDSLIVLESDKASMEVPATQGGKVLKLLISEGDKASEGTPILTLEGAAGEDPAPEEKSQSSAPSRPAVLEHRTSSERHPQEISRSATDVYAGPATRQLARQLGVDLSKVKASGPRDRIQKDDVKHYVKSIMSSQKPSSGASVSSGAGIPPIPEVDFAQFGEIEQVKMSKIKRLTAENMSRNWLNVPHVTQFDDADITDLEAFRKEMKAEAERKGVKLTPLPFLLKACAAALQAEPSFNVSVHADGEHIVQKKFVHIGVAVDTPMGLMVPVIRDVDKKGLYDLAAESVELAGKAREGKLLPRDMQGGCFTISSLGPIGGKGFTPIVNAPEVGILGVSKASMQPVWNGSEFTPRMLLPLALSYDHRAINGADAGRFMTYLCSVLSDTRKMLL